jgi:hypothetical protein
MTYWDTVPVSQVEYFRAKAAECDKQAAEAKDAEAKDAEAKRLLREAAEDWRILVAQVEQRKP